MAAFSLLLRSTRDSHAMPKALATLPMLLTLLALLTLLPDLVDSEPSDKVIIDAEKFVISVNGYQMNWRAVNSDRSHDVDIRAVTRRIGVHLVEFLTKSHLDGRLALYVNTRLVYSGSLGDVPLHSRSLLLERGSLHFEVVAWNPHEPMDLLRVTLITDCPPGWKRVNAECFGSAPVQLDYFDAQLACNAMRANLLVSFGGFDRPGELLDELPESMWRGAWMGVNNIDHFKGLRWINGSKFKGQALKSGSDCDSVGSSFVCRCGAFESKVLDGRVRLRDCNSRRPFLCSMPLLGDDRLYTLPGPNLWPYVWILVACCTGLALCLLVGGRRGQIRQRLRPREMRDEPRLELRLLTQDQRTPTWTQLPRFRQPDCPTASGSPHWPTGYFNEPQSPPGFFTNTQHSPGYFNEPQRPPDYPTQAQSPPGYSAPMQNPLGYPGPPQSPPGYPSQPETPLNPAAHSPGASSQPDGQLKVGPPVEGGRC